MCTPRNASGTHFRPLIGEKVFAIDQLFKLKRRSIERPFSIFHFLRDCVRGRNVRGGIEFL